MQWISKLRKQFSRFSFSKHSAAQKSLAAFCREMATDEYTLIVHSTDINHKRLFPNSFVVSKFENPPAHLHTDAHFQDLQFIGDESFNVIVCIGLLELLPEPQHVICEFHRILKPGGRLITSASAVSPFGGNHFFHFTTNGLRLLFNGWSRFDVLRGSSRPFETIGLLLQKINARHQVSSPIRPLLMLMSRGIAWLDVFVLREYDSVSERSDDRVTDASMPAYLHAVVVK